MVGALPSYLQRASEPGVLSKPDAVYHCLKIVETVPEILAHLDPSQEPGVQDYVECRILAALTRTCTTLRIPRWMQAESIPSSSLLTLGSFGHRTLRGFVAPQNAAPALIFSPRLDSTSTLCKSPQVPLLHFFDFVAPRSLDDQSLFPNDFFPHCPISVGITLILTPHTFLHYPSTAIIYSSLTLLSTLRDKSPTLKNISIYADFTPPSSQTAVRHLVRKFRFIESTSFYTLDWETLDLATLLSILPLIPDAYMFFA
ncbi:hypothetical protein C8R44DRAFT_864999 [Mycena epipterygia]|nr:hypothetical protein C8R44DRAFT_864999 [Mycena epipterygia]